jgi:hypothetical protein
MIIFDKSMLQSLRVDEACWLDAFYLPVITPIFFVETLSDLEKQVAKGMTPEQVVGNLADKTPPNACANMHHKTLCVAELLGNYVVEMSRRPIVGGGEPVVTGDQRGVFFAPAPEMKALSRWQKGEFLEVERDFARVWRRALSGINFEEVYRRYRCKLSGLENAREQAGRLLEKDGSRYSNLKLALETLGVKEGERRAILVRWKALGGPPLSTFAPYTAHVLTVDLFFNLAIGGDLISRDRPSNKIDISYLYYLPFCMIFASNDNLHERTAKCFMREDQFFLRGEEIKADLAKLDEHYSKLPEEVKIRGIMSFASRPPHDGFLTTRLWDRFMAPDWRDHKKRQPDAEMDAKVVEHVNRIADAARKQRGAEHFTGENDDFMVIEKSIPVRMGKWRLVPPEAERSG